MRTAALLLALALVVSACGSKHGSAPAQTTTATATAMPSVQTAVAKTIAAGSEHMLIVAHATASGQLVGLSGTGDFDQGKHLGKLHASLNVSAIHAAIEEVLTGTTVYVSAPQLFSAFLPAGKTWLSVDLATAGKSLGVNGAVLDAQDPSAALAQLKAITGLKELGTTTIGGVATTHYRGTIDLAKLPSAERGALAKTGTTFGAYEVWVGSDGYVHRVRVSTASNGARTTAIVTLSNFGESIIVTVPPADATIDASKLSIPGLSG